MIQAASRLDLSYVFPPRVADDGVGEEIDGLAFTADNANLAKWGAMWSFIALPQYILGFRFLQPQLPLF